MRRENEFCVKKVSQKQKHMKKIVLLALVFDLFQGNEQQISLTGLTVTITCERMLTSLICCKMY